MSSLTTDWFVVISSASDGQARSTTLRSRWHERLVPCSVADPRYLVVPPSSLEPFRRPSEPGSKSLPSPGVCGRVALIDLELAYASRSNDVDDMITERVVLPEAPINAAVLDRALQVAGLLADVNLHRGAKPVDLVIAAAAEAAHLVVLHYDDDYDRIATVTGQAVEWVAKPGDLDH
jgi:predicted nucleic acid-binding protein